VIAENRAEVIYNRWGELAERAGAALNTKAAKRPRNAEE
jgi:hypothetical protein